MAEVSRSRTRGCPGTPAALPQACSRTVVAMLLLLGFAVPGAAQTPVDLHREVFVNSEVERYLRVLQVADLVPLHPWSARAFSHAEIARLAPADSAHPWAGHVRITPVRGFRLHRVHGGLIVNSTLPRPANDGAVWAGRGATLSVEAGASVRMGPLSLTVAPVAFVSQNAAFDLLPNGRSQEERFADPDRPHNIDAPQRFGDGVYGRMEPGQSTLRVDLGPLAVGVSTAHQHWGPAIEYPLVLGSNAPGFPHAFAGTSRPADVGVGRVHGRLVWGSLAQSPYATTHPDSTQRFMAGAVLVFSPAGVSGLEVGGARFFHVPWPEEGLGSIHLRKPFEGFIKSRLRPTPDGQDPHSSVDNQLASIFFRWTAPRSGFEAYGEYAREDHNYDLRDVLLQPDHDAAYLVGIRKVWPSSTSIAAFRAEVVNAQRSHLSFSRFQDVFYVHSATRQGHTHRGRILGSPAVYGGAAAVIALDRYTAGGRWTLSWSRELLGEVAEPPDGLVHGLRVRQTLGAETVRFAGRKELSVGLFPFLELNRRTGGDVFSLQARLTGRVALP